MTILPIILVLMAPPLNMDNIKQYLTEKQQKSKNEQNDVNKELNKIRKGRIRRSLKKDHIVVKEIHTFRTPELKVQYWNKYNDRHEESRKLNVPLLDLRRTDLKVGDIGRFAYKYSQNIHNPTHRVYYIRIVIPERAPPNCVMVNFHLGEMFISNLGINDMSQKLFTFILKSDKWSRNIAPRVVRGINIPHLAKIHGEAFVIVGTWTGTVTGKIYIVELLDLEKIMKSDDKTA